MGIRAMRRLAQLQQVLHNLLRGLVQRLRVRLKFGQLHLWYLQTNCILLIEP